MSATTADIEVRAPRHPEVLYALLQRQYEQVVSAVVGESGHRRRRRNDVAQRMEKPGKLAYRCRGIAFLKSAEVERIGFELRQHESRDIGCEGLRNLVFDDVAHATERIVAHGLPAFDIRPLHFVHAREDHDGLGRLARAADGFERLCRPQMKTVHRLCARAD